MVEGLILLAVTDREGLYGDRNSILDNCHVRAAFATNDERTEKRLSDGLGTATKQRSMRNYAGHRLTPWLVSIDSAASSSTLAADRAMASAVAQIFTR